MKIRARYAVLVAVLAVAIGGYVAYWLYLANAVEPWLAAWAEARRAEGYEVSHGPVEVSGFPFRLLVRVARPGLAGREADGSWRWQGDSLAGVVQPWKLRHVILSFDGEQVLDYRLDGVRRRLGLRARVPLVSLVFDRQGLLERYAIDLKELEARVDEEPEPARIERVQVHGRGVAPEGAAQPLASEIAISVEALTLPPAEEAPLGRTIALAGLRAEVRGAVPAGPLAEVLPAWRDAGGTVEVSRFDLEWGPLAVHGDGTFALDEMMRPMGAAAAKVSGHRETVAALREARWLDAGQARLAKTVLGLLAKDENGSEVLNVPVTAQDGRLYLGPVSVLSLPPLAPPASR